MELTIHRIAFVLACLLCSSHARRVQTAAEQMLKAELAASQKAEEVEPSPQLAAEVTETNQQVEDKVPESSAEVTEASKQESSVSISGKGSKLANLLMACKTDGASMNSPISNPSVSRAPWGSPKQRLSGLQKLQAEAYMIRRQWGIGEL
mmetsp:Transcript_95421/g.165722  ORF Transcript_95421/g.165722 Transcript_95421/m.165722 type:complete len:150 (-) Transcript_95421:46-495(-)